jgi:Ca2+-binding RTX toxin-like protein
VELLDGGIDTVYASATDTMNANVENLFLLGTGNIGGTGNVLDNVMTGNSGNNALNGGTGAGADTIYGLGGVDNLVGGAGDDILDGGEGDDTVSGGAGNDTLIGGVGNDNLLATGTGFDILVFAPGFGNDTVTGFDANPAGGGQDLIDLSAYNGIATVDIVDQGSDTLVTINGTDSILLLGVTGAGANVITADDYFLL